MTNEPDLIDPENERNHAMIKGLESFFDGYFDGYLDGFKVELENLK